VLVSGRAAQQNSDPLDSEALSLGSRMSGPSAQRGLAIRVAAEGLAIVASILLAFGLQAWWDGRELTRQVTEELLGLDGELTANLDAIDLQMDFMRRVSTSTDVLMDSLQKLPEGARILIPDTVFVLVHTVNPTLNFQTGAIEALLSSGHLAEVRSTDLRLGIAGLRDDVADPIEEQLLSRDISVGRLRPLIAAEVPLQDLSRTTSTVDPLAARPSIRLESFGVVPFPNSLAIRNALRERQSMLVASAREMATLRAQIEDLRTLLLAEITAYH